MTHRLFCLLTLLFSLSGPAMGTTGDFGPCSLAAKTPGYKPGDILPDGRIAGMGPGASLNNQAAREAAKALKFEPVKGAPFNSHGQPVFKKGNHYLTPDVDQHSGGVWKMFDQKGRRLGTYDGNMNKIGK
jgi:hypothetical protein